MSDIKLPDIAGINLDKEVSFTYPDGLYEAAALLDFLPNDEAKVLFLIDLARQLQ